jgi:hypothetical protein
MAKAETVLVSTAQLKQHSDDPETLIDLQVRQFCWSVTHDSNFCVCRATLQSRTLAQRSCV